MKRVILCVAILVAVCSARSYADIDTFIDLNGVRLHFTSRGVAGATETVLLIHGYTANGTLNWSAPGIEQALAEKYRVITPDIRGHGTSDAPPEGQHGIHVVEDMIQLLDRVSVRKVHVVGYSMGGMIAIKFATMYPSRVQSLLIGGMGWMPAGSEMAKKYATMTASSPRLQASLRGFGDFATTEEAMKAITVPTKVIIGTKDDLQERVDLWKQIVAALDVLYVDGVTHQGCVFSPEFKQGILDFVAAHSAK